MDSVVRGAPFYRAPLKLVSRWPAVSGPVRCRHTSRAPRRARTPPPPPRPNPGAGAGGGKPAVSRAGFPVSAGLGGHQPAAARSPLRDLGATRKRVGQRPGPGPSPAAGGDRFGFIRDLNPLRSQRLHQLRGWRPRCEQRRPFGEKGGGKDGETEEDPRGSARRGAAGAGRPGAPQYPGAARARSQAPRGSSRSLPLRHGRLGRSLGEPVQSRDSSMAYK